MAKGGTQSKKQSKVSPSKGQLKILNFFTASKKPSSDASTVLPAFSDTSAEATGATACPVVVISDDEIKETVPQKMPSKKRKRNRVELDANADFVPTTPVQRQQRKTRKKALKNNSTTFHANSGFPVTSPEHMIFSYVTEVLQIENAFKIEPRRLFSETSSPKSEPKESDAEPVSERKTHTEEANEPHEESVTLQSEQIKLVICPAPSEPVTNVTEMTEHRLKTVAILEENTSEEVSNTEPVGDMKSVPSNQACVDSLLGDLLLDEWDLGDAFNVQTSAAALDLTSLTRCIVVSSSRLGSNLKLRVQAEDKAISAHTDVLIKLPWSECQVSEGEVVSLQAVQTLSSDWIVDSKAGLLVIKPDTLLSTTTVVGSLFCARKAVLSAMFPGGEPANHAMLLGTLVHELAQTVLMKGEEPTESTTLALAAEMMSSRQHVAAMFSAGLDVKVMLRDVNSFVPNIVAVGNGRRTVGTWTGRLLRVLDSEENIWSPRLGLKGKIDLTAEVSDNGHEFIAPLEIKTGRASGSAEHRGQVMLYQAMLEDINVTCQAGVLLYLKEGVADRVAANQSEASGLVSLRNRLVPFMARPLTRLAPPPDIEPADEKAALERFPPPELPQPITHHNACSRCPQLTICSVFVNSSSEPAVAPDNPLLPLLSTSTKHLSPGHVTYFMRWVALLAMEASESQGAPTSALWTTRPSQRPRCVSNLHVVGGGACEPTREVWLAIGGQTQLGNLIGQKEGAETLKEGDYIALSSDQQPAIYTGTLLKIEEKQFRVLLDRPMRTEHAAQLLHLDILAVADSSSMSRGFLRLIVEDSPRGERLRSVVIDRQPPTFSKLPSSILCVGKEIFSSLNDGQQAAVLKALSADSFLLIKGMPGSGKTHTVSALVELLVATGRTVLLTSHTHSAVDTLLTKVMSRGVKVLRLGSEARISSALRHCTETALLGGCQTPEELGKTFQSLPVVGCTCHGTNHALLSQRTFDVCIVDESTQALQPLVFRALSSARTFILVGDPDQLAPVVRHRAARTLGMDQSLFSRLDGLGATAALSHQYRMNGPITALANAVTYRGLLQCANQQVAAAALRTVTQIPHERWLTMPLSTELVDAVVFLDTGRVATPTGGGAITGNKHEASLVKRLVAAFSAMGIPNNALGVMATYRAQVQLLQRTLDGPEVNTVDQFQGRDKEVIILSCTRSNLEGQDYSKQHQELLGDPRRLTVALTRARHKLVIIGDAQTLENFAPFDRLLRSLDPSHVIHLQDGEDEFSWNM